MALALALVAATYALAQSTASDASSSLAQLCAASATQHLLSCSLQASCPVISQSDVSCSPASLLATACTNDAAVISAAQSSSLCSPVQYGCPSTASATASTDSSCALVSGLPSTANMQQSIFNICKVMPMQGCEECPSLSPSANATATITSCNIISVYARLCNAMPQMKNCAIYSTMCSQSPLPTALASFCPTSSKTTTNDTTTPVMETMPMMQMFFHTGILEYVLFEGFVTNTIGQYIGAIVFVFIISVLFFATGAMRRHRIRCYIHERRERLANGSDQSTSDKSSNGTDTILAVRGSAAPRKRQYLPPASVMFSYEQLEKAFWRTLEAFFAYIMMLIAMTYNVGFFLALMVGVFVGVFVFDCRPELDDESDDHESTVHCI